MSLIRNQLDYGLHSKWTIFFNFFKQIFRDVLIRFEDQIFKNKRPETLEWDMWGALFYVGTIFTTIGLGFNYLNEILLINFYLIVVKNQKKELFLAL